MDEHPQPPADAYYPMARILGIRYFCQNPQPRSGVSLSVSGRDGRETHWRLTEREAALVARQLPRGFRVHSSVFDERTG